MALVSPHQRNSLLPWALSCTCSPAPRLLPDPVWGLRTDTSAPSPPSHWPPTGPLHALPGLRGFSWCPHLPSDSYLQGPGQLFPLALDYPWPSQGLGCTGHCWGPHPFRPETSPAHLCLKTCFLKPVEKFLQVVSWERLGDDPVLMASSSNALISLSHCQSGRHTEIFPKDPRLLKAGPGVPLTSLWTLPATWARSSQQLKHRTCLHGASSFTAGPSRIHSGRSGRGPQAEDLSFGCETFC